jgi:rubrerythrin
MQAHVASLRALAESYRRAEAEIVKAYFDKRRSKKDHLHWLKAQAFKEHAAINPLLKLLGIFYLRFDGEVDRHDFEEIAEKLAEETKHARLVMDLLEEIGGRKVTPRDLVWLPEDKKLARVRARYSKTYAALLHGSRTPSDKEMRRKDEGLERAAVTLTEGGGGALYEVCVRLKKGAIERKIAAAFREIHRDEMDHKNAGARNLAQLVRRGEDFDRAAEIIRQVSSQRLRMRNEQFGFPLSEERIRKLERRCASSVGKVTPSTSKR